ncbi:COA4 factor, partial [Brachypteracias leptosomus]|nr:COA4 factor [Brachypteracias leptosomus]
MARPGHGRDRPPPKAAEEEEEEEEEDPVDAMIARTGCLEQHRRLQECMAEKRDWRHCQSLLRAFGDCMARQSPRET